MASVRTYYHLTKPGIIRGNSLNLIAGFLFASRTHIDLWLLAAVLSGSALVIAGGCVFNNYFDRSLDKRMKRTRNRAFVTGSITPGTGLLYGTALTLGGLIILSVYTNKLTALLGALGFIFYVVIYGYAKRTTSLGTLVGSISGALPPVAGYTAVTGGLDGAALLLFIVLASWQMPHFYAIAIQRLADYKSARIPVLPAIKGVQATKRQIYLYVALFCAAGCSFTLAGYTGICFLAGIVALTVFWAIRARKPADDTTWARSMFFASLSVILGLDVLLAIGARLP